MEVTELAFGTAPGQAVKDDWDEVEEGSPTVRSGGTYDLVRYFFNHPKVKFGRPSPTAKESAALAASIKRLRHTYTDDSIRRAIDRFYLTRTAKNSEMPGISFCNKELQLGLLEDTGLVERQDDVLTFLANGCQREEGLDLPWDEEHDSSLRLMFIIEQDYNVLVRTYPDVVSEILFHWGNDDDGRGGAVMQQALIQMMYLTGASDVRGDLTDMHANFSVPSDFAKKSNRPRKTRDTITEAVRASRGR
jgi:hypothetical protein